MANLLKIDELTVDEHIFLTLELDECYYLFNYTARKGFSYSECNSLISNLKKKPTTANSQGYHYKAQAIIKVAKLFRDIFDDEVINSVTFVPIPPSKIAGHPDYDDRMIQILNKAFEDKNADIREIVEQISSTEAAHLSDVRPTINEIKNNFKINENLADNISKTVFVVDDVLTTGAHFKAMKRFLKDRFPNINIIGIFICRREIEDENID